MSFISKFQVTGSNRKDSNNWRLKSVHFPQSLAGFTMVELLMVMTMVGVLAGVILVTYPASQERARDSRRRSDIKQYQLALETYMNRNNNYSTATGNLVGQCGTLGLTGCPDDPEGTNLYQVSSDGAQYVLWSRLETKDVYGSTTYFIVCSNGRTGMYTSASGPTCPLP